MGCVPLEFFACDVEASHRLLEEGGRYIRPKECYSNIHRLTTARPNALIAHPLWRVAYGGVEVEGYEGLFLKHAFFLDTETGKVVDPTLAASPNDKFEKARYIIGVTYDLRSYTEVCLAFQSCDSWWNKGIREHMTRLERQCLNNGCVLGG